MQNWLAHAATRLLGVFLIFFAVYHVINHSFSLIYGGVIHAPSLIFVGLGIIGILFASYSFETITGIMKSLIFFSPDKMKNSLKTVESNLASLTEIYYEKGPAFFYEEVKSKKLHPVWLFLGAKLESRIPIEDIKILLQNQASQNEDELSSQIGALQGLTSVSPAVGMTGTILGLIKLLKDLDQYESLGSNMALAFITALYGLMFGNFLFIPLVNRLSSVREESSRLTSQCLFWLDVIAHRKPAGYLNNDDHNQMMKKHE